MTIFDRFRGIVCDRHVVVVELGCNDGEDTDRLCSIGLNFARSYRHIAVEPVPWLIDQARKRRNAGVVEFINAAASDRVGTAKLWVSRKKSGADPIDQFWARFSKTNGSSSLNAPTGHVWMYPWIEHRDQIEVDTTTLDRIFDDAGIDHVDFVWADVEGGERLMIAGGASRFLPATRYLYTEYGCNRYHNDATLQDIVDLLHDWNVVENYPNGSNPDGNALLGNPRMKALESALAVGASGRNGGCR